jgi:hypothetical protein
MVAISLNPSCPTGHGMLFSLENIALPHVVPCIPLRPAVALETSPWLASITSQCDCRYADLPSQPGLASLLPAKGFVFPLVRCCGPH